MTELAWHFVAGKLRDGRPIPPDGEWLVHEGECVMCRSGLHASRRIIDALSYAPGAIVCRVEVDDIVAADSDKLLCPNCKSPYWDRPRQNRQTTAKPIENRGKSTK